MSLVNGLFLLFTDIEKGDVSTDHNECNNSAEILINEKSHDEVIIPKVFSTCEVYKFPIGGRARFLDSEGYYKGGTVCWTGYKNPQRSENSQKSSTKLVVVRLVSLPSLKKECVIQN